LVVGVCPPYYQIGETSQVCEPDCNAHGIGNIPDASDCKKYFTCSEVSLLDGKTYMQRTSKSCPNGNSYDPKLFMCVPEPDGTICKP
nr:chitin binding domain-containing protein [Shewanella shenzhenensis]